ncbi:MAG: prepilin-type N-terminal cleavage/methylation domain-containing protein [Desulfobacterales bacterium]|nr:prepilin-type N-terminal cleavage/methylation domain-containing protein [Desulfobacterales bacterium]
MQYKINKFFVKGNNGFTLIELLIVAVILGIFGTIIVLGSKSFIESMKKERTTSDVGVIKKAILSFYFETGELPNRKNQHQSKYDIQNRYKLLCTLPSDNNPANMFSYLPKITKDAGRSFKVSFEDIDDLANHLIKPTGRGYDPRLANWSYIAKINLDPWGKSYIINIYNMYMNYENKIVDDPDLIYTVYHVWVLSAGPNGLIETTDISKSNESPPKPGGDDIGVLLE